MVYVVSARFHRLQTRFTHIVVSNTVMNVKSDMYKIGRVFQLPTLRPHLDRSKGSPRRRWCSYSSKDASGDGDVHRREMQH